MTAFFAKIKHALWFLVGLIRDPNSLDLSSSRFWGGALIVAGIVVAIYGAWHNHEYAATATGLTGTGLGALAARAKTTPPGKL